MIPITPVPADSSAARQALACLDLTSLADGHDKAGGEREVEQLCARADGR